MQVRGVEEERRRGLESVVESGDYNAKAAVVCLQTRQTLRNRHDIWIYTERAAGQSIARNWPPRSAPTQSSPPPPPPAGGKVATFAITRPPP